MCGPRALTSSRDSLGKIASASIDEIKQLLHGVSIFRAESLTTKTDHIQTGHAVDALSCAKMRDVFAERTIALNNAEVSNAEELMKDSATTEEGVVSNRDMTGDEDAICENAAVSHLHIMPEMCSDHDEVTIANFSQSAVFRAAMNCGVFTNGIVLANADSALNPIMNAQVLRLIANDGTAADTSPLPNYGVSDDLSMRGDFASCTDLYRTFDDHISADVCCWVNLGFGGDKGSWVNHLDFKVEFIPSFNP